MHLRTNSCAEPKEEPASQKTAKPSKTSFDPETCRHQPKCSNLPWHLLVLIAEAAGLPFIEPAAKDLANAKRLAKAFEQAGIGDTTAAVQGTVAYMLAKNGDYWNVRVPVDAAGVLKCLPLHLSGPSNLSPKGDRFKKSWE